ncbi:hypothetical protein C5167_014825 [Papaver somniferum]|uniref:DUF7796 domain-containing protein n=1 Tax=Papaver somniferum TaxID=3469 RepID=A0A4Y7J8C5_PAPSO|nr:hypothetical protein C5167_014825 [Papaver somniferum]
MSANQRFSSSGLPDDLQMVLHESHNQVEDGRVLSPQSVAQSPTKQMAAEQIQLFKVMEDKIVIQLGEIQGTNIDSNEVVFSTSKLVFELCARLGGINSNDEKQAKEVIEEILFKYRDSTEDDTLPLKAIDFGLPDNVEQGGARKFELTGPSIAENILNVYPNADLFLNAPLDKDSFKFSILKDVAPRIASIRIFQPTKLNETEFQRRVLTAYGSPNGIQGLLQYFSLVEGCLTLINAFQIQNNFTYDWIVRTRVDGYWNAPLSPDNFLQNHYLVPAGSRYNGCNDRLGIGHLYTSQIALSRLSLIPQLDAAGFRQLNSEASFKAQLTTQGVKFLENRLPFCIVSARRFGFPHGLPVASMSSPGPLSGAYCRPCTPVCAGPCADDMMTILPGWSRIDGENGTVQFCDAHGEWESGWENNFDRFAGEKLGELRKRVMELKLETCVKDFDEMKKRTVNWDAPAAKQICGIGLRR